jgi:chromosomal replication initiation ATPase DnaA
LDGLKGGIADPFKDVPHQSILGDSDFVAKVKSKYIEKGSLREQPVYRGMVLQAIEPEVVVSCIAAILGLEVDKIKVRSGDGVVRGIVAEMLYRYSALTQREIGKLLGGIDYTAVSMLRHRLKKRIENDRVVSDKYAQVEHRLKSICEV